MVICGGGRTRRTAADRGHPPERVVMNRYRLLSSDKFATKIVNHNVGYCSSADSFVSKKIKEDLNWRSNRELVDVVIELSARVFARVDTECILAFFTLIGLEVKSIAIAHPALMPYSSRFDFGLVLNFRCRVELRLKWISVVTKTTSSVLLTGGGGAGEGGEPLGAPSPADSGVAELEHAGAHPGPSPRHADGVHADYSPSDRISRPHEVRLRTPRALMLNYVGRGDRGAGGTTVGERDAELVRVRRERALLRQRLEDTEWSLCQRAGEIALLKTQLKDAQNEQTAKGHEYLTMKADCRQLREALDRKEKEIIRLRTEAEDKDALITRLRGDVERLSGDLRQSNSELTRTKESSSREIERLKTELKELRQELSDVSLSGYEGVECGRTVRGIYDVCKVANTCFNKCIISISGCQANEYHWSSNDSALEDAEVQRLNGELPDPCAEPCPAADAINRLKIEMDSKEKQFNSERRKWSEEKDKVLRYQKQLQLNYVQMYRRSRTLEAEVDSLRLELELCNKNVKNLATHAKPIEL
ncbi:Leucine zipper putative tumor suppressor 2 [Eumeta japonica]|uniref:Leucine zipper putative tumor suppressor 2 n=1 Tax=Eumeta variegata TaxID=151549 RepID=A0A4C1WMC5_EUMVA|nr:Leucine zipper putative tumor suppressor 2 [Eumeta japonica]